MQCRDYVSKKVRIVSTLFSFIKPVWIRLRVMAPTLASYYCVVGTGHCILHPLHLELRPRRLRIASISVHNRGIFTMADAEHADIDVHEVGVAVIQDPGFWLRAPGSGLQGPGSRPSVMHLYHCICEFLARRRRRRLALAFHPCLGLASLAEFCPKSSRYGVDLTGNFRTAAVTQVLLHVVWRDARIDNGFTHLQRRPAFVWW